MPQILPQEAPRLPQEASKTLPERKIAKVLILTPLVVVIVAVFFFCFFFFFFVVSFVVAVLLEPPAHR